MLVDTHAHLHHEGLNEQIDDVLKRAQEASVTRIINVGCDEADSLQAIKVAQAYDNVWATVGLHPHEASRGPEAWERLGELVPNPKVVAIGECGLDYYYNHSTADQQEGAFRFQIELAQKHDLAMIFHIRDAFEDFFRIIDDYPGVRGVVHCFSSTEDHVRQAVQRGFYVALGGIMTFTKDPAQLAAAKAIPLNRLLLETDSPFLSPPPKRGRTNEPANLAIIADFLAQLRGESREQIAVATTSNALKLFGIK